MFKRVLAIPVFAVCLTALSLISAFGQEQSITSVSLSFSWDKSPKGGDIVGSIFASSGSSQYKVEGAEYLKKDDTWSFGERPEAEVELSAQDGYRFSGVSRSSFSLSGLGVQYKDFRTESDGSTLILQVYLPDISGSLPATTATGWNGDAAQWDVVDGAKQYEVRLYKDRQVLTTQTVKGSSRDFSAYINTEGSYTFNVRSLGAYTTQSGEWSADSDAKVVTREDAWYRAAGSWEKAFNGWRFKYKDGTYAANSWKVINDTWYYFNNSGIMESNCYVKSDAAEMFYWLGSDGAWMPEWNTAAPDRGSYRVVQ